jgi:Zn-dependent M28 family amino/carboxypeptidase
MLIGLAFLLLAGAVTWWMTGMPGRSHAGPIPSLSAAEQELRARLERHVRTLAGEIGERNVFQPPQLAYAARYLEERLRESGYAVVREGFTAAAVDVHNVVVERRGATRPDEIVVVGAHYDSVMGSPGANDNATGVAAVLEIARGLARQHPERTVRCAFFVNEEPPFYLTGEMGSLVHARLARKRGDAIVAMLSIETIGYYTDAERSQHYPFPFALLYPAQGNFLGFVGNLGSRGLVRRAIGAFRRGTAFPSEGLAAPASIPGIGWSDHWSFWQQGYPAVMVTDTAVFRYGPYHTREDTPEKVTYDAFTTVVAGLERVVLDLAGPEQPVGRSTVNP